MRDCPSGVALFAMNDMLFVVDREALDTHGEDLTRWPFDAREDEDLMVTVGDIEDSGAW